tara:strand:- start:361 stop:567 length:207 start_codon:yes stop_codon:yes gene_type:complete
MSKSNEIVNLDDLARILQLSKRWLRGEVKARRIPYLKAGHRLLFNADAVRRCLAARAEDSDNQEGGVK